MKVFVRSATEADLPALLTLYGELNPDDAPLRPESADAVWAAVSTQQGRTVLVAVAGDALAGTADCLVMPNLTRGGRAVMFVENVVVASAIQRRGIGRQLMEAAVRLGESAGCYKVQFWRRTTRTCTPSTKRAVSRCELRASAATSLGRPAIESTRPRDANPGTRTRRREPAQEMIGPSPTSRQCFPRSEVSTQQHPVATSGERASS